ncbi:MAG TPA: chemotaxis protein CheX [Feifaniaceae bacterium]|nr:chemotaxis protein CheX [Feifaniaceae bacterium]
MSEALYRPFLQATQHVFRLMLDLDNVYAEPLRGDTRSLDAVEVSIGVTGDLTGRVVYSFPYETCLNMVNIMSGMEISEVDEFVTSAIGEIANIISGNVMTLLTDEDLACDILPPRVVTGEAEKGQYALNTVSCIVTSVGNICLDIMLNPAQ